MKNRHFSLDLIKACACFLVVLVHFSKYSGLYVNTINSPSLFLQVCVRWFAFICVPLFLLATGYLQCEKGISKKFYRSLLPLLATYAVIALACFFFRKFYLMENLDYFGGGLIGLLNFTAHPYAWYVEMYVGLFLLIPFLNLIHSNLQTKRQELLIIGVLLLITSAFTLLRSFTVQGTALNISTDWWETAYPITYYFIGAYIRKYQPVFTGKMKAAGAVAILVIVLFESYFSTAKNHVFDENAFSGYNSIYTVAAAVLFFLIFYRADTNSAAVKTVVSAVSRRTLDIYLFSFFFDKLYYPFFYSNFQVTNLRYAIGVTVVVPLIVASAFACSLIKEWIFNGFIHLVKTLRSRPKQEISAQ